MAEQILKAANPQVRLIIALARYGGLRCGERTVDCGVSRITSELAQVINVVGGIAECDRLAREQCRSVGGYSTIQCQGGQHPRIHRNADYSIRLNDGVQEETRNLPLPEPCWNQS